MVAATGVASLIFLRTRYTEVAGRGERRTGRALSPAARSVVFDVVTRLLFPVMILCSLFYLFTGHSAPGGGFAAGLIAGLALMIRYLAGGRAELDEAAPIDAGKLLGLGLLISALSALAPVAFGGKILQSYAFDVHLGPLGALHTPWGNLPLLGEIHLVTSLFFDIGVYLVVIGVMLVLARSLGSGIDQHQVENRTPVPRPTPERSGSGGRAVG